MKLRVQFITDDENGCFHIGGVAGIDIFQFAQYWSIADGEALLLYNDLYLYPTHIDAGWNDSLSELLERAERAIGMPEHTNNQGARPYELLLHIDKDLFRFDDSGMKLAKLRKYFSEEQITDVFFTLKNLAGEVLSRQQGLKYEIRPDEHGPHNTPHVHVSTIDGTKSVNLRIPDGYDLSEGISRFPKEKLAEARRIVVKNGPGLMDEWRKAVDGIIRITSEELNSAVVRDCGPCKDLPPRNWKMSDYAS